MRATAWSLDEFASADGFADFTPSASLNAAPAPAELHAEREAQWEYDRANAESEAYERGRRDGERAAREALEEPFMSALQALTEAVESVRLHEARWVGHAEENIAALAVMVARHVVQREVMADASFVRDLVQSAMQQYSLDQELTIRLHPEDLQNCRSSIDETGRREIRWISDPTIHRGGCLTEGRERIIDGRVDTSLERAYRSLGNLQA